MAKRRMILYFGSFNPVHKGHIAMAEHVMDKDLGDEVAMIVSPQNPFKAEWMQAPRWIVWRWSSGRAAIRAIPTAYALRS